MTKSDDWEPVNYHNLPHWMKRVSKPKQWVDKTYTKIFYSKPYNYKVQYTVIHGKLRISYWRSFNTQNPAPIPDPIIPSKTSSKRLKSYHYLLIFLVLAGVSFVVITHVYPSTKASSSEIPNQIITVSQEIISNIKPQQPQTQEIERFIFEMTNTERQKNGFDSLTFNANLANVARKHSQDMVNNNYFSHTNLIGDGPSERAEKAGLSKWGIGENIGMMASGNVKGIGYVSNTPESIAQALMKNWMGSPGHRSNILRSSYDYIGVGVAYNGHEYIATQDFWDYV